jgi:hypothetical protein
MTTMFSLPDVRASDEVTDRGRDSVKGLLASTFVLGTKLTLGPAAVTLLLVMPSVCKNSDDESVSPSPTVIDTGIERDPGGMAIADPANAPESNLIIWVVVAFGSMVAVMLPASSMVVDNAARPEVLLRMDDFIKESLQAVVMTPESEIIAIRFR